MSEEEYSEEEVEVEAEEVPKHVDTKRSRERIDAPDADELTEVESALQAAKRRIDDDDQAKLQDYEDRRRLEREREEEELRILKEKQEQRRLQREEEEREMEERRLAEEERRKAEEEERKAKLEADRKKKEEEKQKRQQMVGVGFGTPTGGRNFILPEKKKEQSDKFGNIVQAKQEMGMTKDQKEEAKKLFVAQMMKQLGDLTTLGGPDLKVKLKDMHTRICKLEAEKYDLEKRLQTQEYDLKELNERQRQINRQKMVIKGMDPNTAGSSRFPPKVAIFSKYDRQIDRRNFGERRSIYDKKNAYPCFPNVPPPTTILEFKPLPDGPRSPGADQNGGMEVDGEDEGEEEEEEEEE